MRPTDRLPAVPRAGTRGREQAPSSGAGGVQAAVDVDHLTGGRREPVRQQCDHGASGRVEVLGVPAQRGALRPDVVEGLGARNRLLGDGRERSGGDHVAADAVRPQVAGQIARGALQRGLGHAHPVVGGPGLPGVEGQAHHRAPAGHQRTAGHRQAGQRVRRDVDRGLHIIGGGGQEFASQRGLRVGEGDRVDDAVQVVDVLADLIGQTGQVLVVGDIEFEQRRFGVEPLDDSPGQAQRPSEVGDQDGGALALGDLGHPVGDRGVHGHARDQDVLALQDSHSVPFLSARMPQWPMPRPPSTGMTAPEM